MDLALQPFHSRLQFLPSALEYDTLGLCGLVDAIAQPWEVLVSSEEGPVGVRVPWLSAQDPPPSAASLGVDLSCRAGRLFRALIKFLSTHLRHYSTSRLIS